MVALPITPYAHAAERVAAWASLPDEELLSAQQELGAEVARRLRASVQARADVAEVAHASQLLTAAEYAREIGRDRRTVRGWAAVGARERKARGEWDAIRKEKGR